MPMIFDHLGLVVAGLQVGRKHLTDLFQIERWTVEFEDPLINVWVQFGLDRSGMRYELIAPRNDQSPIVGALKKGTAILNHVAYLVDSIEAEA